MRIGYTPAIVLVGIVMCMVLAPLIWRYLRPTPASLGLVPDGASVAANELHIVRADYPRASLAQLFARRSFATLSASFALGMFAQVGVVAHLVTRLVPILGVAQAAAPLSVVGKRCRWTSAVGRCTRQTDRRVVAAANFVMQAAGVALLAVGTAATAIVPGCILFGLGVGNLLTLPPLIAQREFPPETVSRAVALITAVNQAVFPFAPALLGVLREVSGSYLIPFLVRPRFSSSPPAWSSLAVSSRLRDRWHGTEPACLSAR
jgi:hypothetical protein